MKFLYLTIILVRKKDALPLTNNTTLADMKTEILRMPNFAVHSYCVAFVSNWNDFSILTSHRSRSHS